MLFLFNYLKISFGIIDFVVLLTTVVSLFIFRYYFLYFTRENPLPGPFPLPFVGSLLNVKEDLSKYFLGVQQKHGDLAEVWVANSRIVLTTRKDYTEKFLSSSTKSKYMMRNTYKEGFEELGIARKGIVVNYDFKSWRFNRTFFTKTIMNKKFLDEAIEMIQERFKEMNEYWDNSLKEKGGETLEINLVEWVNRFIVDNVMPLMTGKEFHSTLEKYYYKSNNKDIDNPELELELESESILKDLKMSTEDIQYFGMTSYFIRHYIPILRSKTKEYLKARDSLWEKMDKLIAEKKKEIEKIENKDDLRHDMLTILITANTDKDIMNIKKFEEEEFNRPLTNDEIRENILEALNGGIDTTSNLFSSTVYHIAKHPTVLKKLREEINKVFFNNNNRGDDIVITQEKLTHLVYCEAVIKETSRLAPTVLGINRINTEKDMIGGLEWSANAQFLVNITAMNLDPLVWENVDEFNPDRFLIDDDNDNNGKEVLIFGGGHRICPGRKLAMVQLKCLLVLFCYYWDIELVDKNQPLKYKHIAFNKVLELFVRIKPHKI